MWHMRWMTAAVLAVMALAGPVRADGGDGAPSDTPDGRARKQPDAKSNGQAKPKPKTIYVAIFDFTTEVNGQKVPADRRAPLKKQTPGLRLADSVRLRLRRHEAYEVLDRFTMAEFGPPVGFSTPAGEVTKMMTERLGVHVGVCGTVRRTGRDLRVVVRGIDLRDPKQPHTWEKVLTDNTERWRAVMSKALVEAVTGEDEWVPPQYGDEAEPKDFGRPLNTNGDFERGRAGWDPPDGVCTFLAQLGGDRGTVLRVRTDVQNDPWIEYRRRLRLGKASVKNPPKIPRDTGYSSVGGLAGVHYRGEWIEATAGQRYWLTVDHKGLGGAKVFVKGFRRTPAGVDGLPESSLAELGLTPQQFAALPAERRRELIEKDAEKNPKRHLRECYRWYLNCEEAKGEWMHLAAPFPPRGGLPDDVDFLQIQIYSYWPPGEYLWDNCFLYKDPRQKGKLAEEPARTPEFQRRRRINEEEIRREAEGQRRPEGKENTDDTDEQRMTPTETIERP